MFYRAGTTHENFLLWVLTGLLQVLRPRRRVITMDNLTSSCSREIKNAFESEGHVVVCRPIHSCDFGPVEWTFNYLDQFLQAHSGLITDANLRSAISACFDTVTPAMIRSYFANAHFWTPDHNYVPYNGQN